MSHYALNFRLRHNRWRMPMFSGLDRLKLIFIWKIFHLFLLLDSSKGGKMVCAKCGEFLEEAATTCLACTPRSYVLKAESGKIRITGSPVGFVVEGPPDHPDGRRVDYRPAPGGQSVSQTDVTGTFQADLSGSLERGRSGERHVM